MKTKAKDRDKLLKREVYLYNKIVKLADKKMLKLIYELIELEIELN